MCGYVACVPDFRGGKHNRLNHDTPAHRPPNYTLYDMPPIRFVFQATQKDLRSNLMAGDCRNIYEPVYRIKEWYKSVHSVGYFYYA
jgi:hypothetical protein